MSTPADGVLYSLEIHGSLAVLPGLSGSQKARNPTVMDCGV